MIAPSHFNSNFQFPGNQIFFKDFIIAAEHQTTFIEQLKIILTNELIDMNDSTYETLNLSTVDETEQENRHEYVVKADTLSTLSVLAKFLGLILARPFMYDYGINTVVDNHQIELRNKVRAHQPLEWSRCAMQSLIILCGGNEILPAILTCIFNFVCPILDSHNH